jgi:hypothetical protein
MDPLVCVHGRRLYNAAVSCLLEIGEVRFRSATEMLLLPLRALIVGSGDCFARCRT